MRSVRKAEKSLPRSPRKRNAVVSSLKKKFQLRILPQHSQSTLHINSTFTTKTFLMPLVYVKFAKM